MRVVKSDTVQARQRAIITVIQQDHRIGKVQFMVPFNPLDWLRSRGQQARCRHALSSKPSLEEAAREVTVALGPAEADLALVFVSSHFASDLTRLLPLLQKRLNARHWLGCLGGGVVGTTTSGEAHEVERTPALSISLLNLPGAELNSFSLDSSQLPDLDGAAKNWQDWVGVSPSSSRSMLLLLDPGCNAINDLVSGLDYAYPGIAKVGGIALPHNADHGSLLCGDQVVGGAVGLSIGGTWSLDPVVAQGCRPIGPVFAIEQAQRNVLLELSDGDRRASPVACLQRVLADLSAEDRELVQHSLFLGVEREELIADAMLAGLSHGGTSGDRPARAFLVRNLIGVDPRNGAVAVADRVRAGQNVQFQLREAQASRLEARQLLQTTRDQRGDQAPLIGLLFACLGRGKGLFGSPDGDVSIARDVFSQLPVAGSFCNGEIGPLGGATHLHGYTACWGLLRCDPPEGATRS